MSDPLTAWAATGAASSVIQIIEFTAELVKKTAQLTKSACGTLAENKVIEQHTLRHSQLADQILGNDDPKRPLNQMSDGEKAIDALARECKDASNDLLNLLKDLEVDATAKGVMRTIQSGHKAAKSLRKRQAIEIKQNYLDRLNGQLSTALLLHLRDNRLSIRQSVFEHINDKYSQNAVLIQEFKMEILEALATHPKIAKEKREYILDSLSFDGMHSRQLAIPRACRESLSWIFADTSRFKDWLASPNDIFWVAGKAGSGKSTLMKHVANHPSVRADLRKWAGSAPIELMIAQNYMWHPGVSMQRDKQGMLKGLLFQIIRSNQQLAEFTPRWQHDFLNIKEQDPWSEEELIEGMATIFDNTTNWARYCLFIDGLDEYEDDHSKLISTVMALSKHANVKIVVSSREWNPFCNAFGKLQDKIYLHEHTHEDIQSYVRQELDPPLMGNPMAKELKSRIVDKAMGVFFWVFLVVCSVRTGLEEGDSVTILRERVDELPSRLEDYFALILRRIDKVYRKRTYRALKLAELTIGENARNRIHDDLSFVRFWLLSLELLDDPRFAFDFDFQYIDDERLEQICSETKRFLSACCKDFLDIRFAQVEFLHRTVHDFLTTDHVRRSIDENVPNHFKETLFPLQLALCRLKVVTSKSSQLWQDTLQAVAKEIGVPARNDQAVELIKEYENTATCYVDRCQMPDHDFLSNEYWQPTTNAMRHMAAFLESYQLGSFLETVVTVDSSIIRWDDDAKSCSILQSTLGMARYHPFSIAKINWASLQVLLQYGVLANAHEIPNWHAFLLKAVKEKDGWCPQEREYAVKIVKLLVRSGAHFGGRVDVPKEFSISTGDPSYPFLTPMDILDVIFAKADLEFIFESNKRFSTGQTTAQKGDHRASGAQVISSKGLPVPQCIRRTNRPLHEPALEIPRLGRAIVVALFHAGLAGLGLE